MKKFFVGGARESNQLYCELPLILAYRFVCFNLVCMQFYKSNSNVVSISNQYS